DVPVRQHHQVPRVVRVQVEHRVHRRAAGHDEPFLVGQLRDAAERAALRTGVLDVGQPVRGPEPAEPVGRADAVTRFVGRLARLAHAPILRTPQDVAARASAFGEALLRLRIQSTTVVTASATGTPLSWLPSRNRKLTAPASWSRPPTSSRNGTFWRVWVRI